MAERILKFIKHGREIFNLEFRPETTFNTYPGEAEFYVASKERTD